MFVFIRGVLLFAKGAGVATCWNGNLENGIQMAFLIRNLLAKQTRSASDFLAWKSKPSASTNTFVGTIYQHKL